MSETRGWAIDERAVFVQVDQSDDRMKLFVQQGRSVVPLATFYNADAAQIFLDWQNEAISLQAQANADLLHKLQNEQPLLFAQGPPPMDAIDLDDVEQ